ncbi:MAG: 30S ribosomal protein S20, partial [candidate division NC10 bacterium]
VDNYRRILEIAGQIAGEMIAPNAERIDREGNTLNPDGTVTLHPLVQRNLDRLAQADMMGFTLPQKYGGLNWDAAMVAFQAAVATIDKTASKGIIHSRTADRYKSRLARHLHTRGSAA